MTTDVRRRRRGVRTGRARGLAAATVLGLLATGATTVLAAAPAAAERVVRPADVRPTDFDADRVDDGLQATLAQLDAGATTPTVVRVGPGGADALLAEAAAELGPLAVSRTFREVPGFAAELTRDQVAALLALDPHVEVEADVVVRADTDRARRDLGVSAAVQELGVDGDAAGDGVRTYGPGDIVVAVLDSGIDAGHVDLDGGKVLEARDMVAPGSDPSCPAHPRQGQPFDDNGHGTHVAATIAADGDSGPASAGIAPGAALVSVKVLRCNGTGVMSEVNAGIEWVLQNRARLGIDVMNLSLGSSAPSDGTDATSRLLNRAAAAGIVVFQSAGNAGPALRTVTGQATARHAITVGAVSDLGTPGLDAPRPGWGLAPFSSRGPTLDGRVKPDVVAPGVGIVAARAGTRNGLASMSGTSMATPVAAGVGALVLHADPARRPSGTACGAGDTRADCRDGVLDATMRDGVREALVATAVDLGPAGPDPDWGGGRIDAGAALALATGTAGSGAPEGPTTWSTSGTTAGPVTDVALVVPDVRWPVSVTVVLPAWAPGGADVDVDLLDPAGALVATSATTTRQETLAVWPQRSGTFLLRLRTASAAPVAWDAVASGVRPTGPTSRPSALTAPVADGSGPAPTGAPAGATYVPVTPTRALDTRTDDRPLTTGETRTASLRSAGIPATATAVAFNLTGTDPTAATYLTAWPAGTPRPTASNLNLTPGQTDPNLVITATGPDATINLYNDHGTTAAIIDVVGYWTTTPPS